MSKNRMKKFVSILLALTMTVLCFVPAAAAEPKDKVTPILIIAGFSEYALVDGDGNQVWGPSQDAIVEAAKNAIAPLGAFLKGDYETFCTGIVEIANNLFEPVSCNPDGTAKHPDVTVIDQYTEPVSQYGLDEVTRADVFDKDIVDACCDEVGADNVYVYGLTWHKSMQELAADINTYVKKIKADKHVDKVSIAGHSMGGAVLASYLGLYGCDDVSNITMLNSAFTGLDMVGCLFKGEIAVGIDKLIPFINQSMNSDTLGKVLDTLKLLQLAVPKLEGFLETELPDGSGRTYKDRIYTECLVSGFGYTPSLWAFVPDEYYNDAKAVMKAYMEKNQQQSGVSASVIAANWATFERKIDEIHDIQANISSILQRAKASGTSVCIFSNYNLYIAPFTPTADYTSDGVIETNRTSGGATCARLKTTLGDDYVQARDVGHNCLSEDGIIDASTCMLPENTWFIKNYGHSMFDYRKNGCDLYVRAMTAKTQPTVDTWAEYPQFLVYNAGTHYVAPLTAKLGDVDLDGSITPVDSRLALRYVNGMEELSPTAKYVADANRSGDISTFDAEYILKMYTGLV